MKFLRIKRTTIQKIIYNNFEDDMFNKRISSHWRLAFKTFRNALFVTLQTGYAMLRAKFYSLKISEKLMKQRKEHDEIIRKEIERQMDLV